MAIFRITVINQTFQACTDHELDSVEAARKQGIRGALAIGADEVANGKPFFGAEVKLEDGEEVVGRFLVSIGSSPLQ
jgi:hypothetical protein